MANKRWTKRADGRYHAQVYLGLDENGKPLRKSLYARSSRELEGKVADLKCKLHKGFDVAAASEAFSKWSARYLSARMGDGLSSGHANALKAHIKKWDAYIGAVPLEQLHTADLQPLIDDYRARNPFTGKPSSPKLLNDMKNIAKGVFDYAIENRVTDYNPAAYLRIPAQKQTTERRALTEQEQAWIVATDHRAKPAVMIMMYAGLRRGELIPLRWSAVDFREGTLTVERFVEMVNGRPVEKLHGKSDAARRVIDIPDVLLAYLAALKAERQPSEFALICTGVRGKMHTQSSWDRMWESYMEELERRYGHPTDAFGNVMPVSIVPPFTAHWLRHTFATMLYHAGVDVLTARDQLGHSNIRTTLDIYTHLDKTYKRRSMNKLNAYLEESKKA